MPKTSFVSDLNIATLLGITFQLTILIFFCSISQPKPDFLIAASAVFVELSISLPKSNQIFLLILRLSIKNISFYRNRTTKKM